MTAWAFAQADIKSGRLIAPWGFKALASRFTNLRPSLANHRAADRFATWLVASGVVQNNHRRRCSRVCRRLVATVNELETIADSVEACLTSNKDPSCQSSPMPPAAIASPRGGIGWQTGPSTMSACINGEVLPSGCVMSRWPLCWPTAAR